MAECILLHEHNVQLAITAVALRSKADAGRVDTENDIEIIRPGCVRGCDLNDHANAGGIDRAPACILQLYAADSFVGRQLAPIHITLSVMQVQAAALWYFDLDLVKVAVVGVVV